MSVIPFYRRSDDPGLDDVTGGPDPVPAPLEHVEHLHRAYAHMTACKRHLAKALALIDDEPLQDDDDIDPVEFDPSVGDNPEGQARRALRQRYARALKSSVAPNI